VRPSRNSSSQGKEKRQAKSFKGFQPSRLRPIGPSLGIAALVIALAVVGLSLVSSSPKPPSPPKAASSGLDFQLKENDTHHVTLDVFVLFAQMPHSIVVLVPHVQLKPGETVPWRVIATGAMKAAQLNGSQQPITVVHQHDSTVFYGLAHHQASMDATFLGEPPNGPEQAAFIGPALVLKVPGPFIRFADGYAVVGLPALGEQALTISSTVGGSGASTMGFGNPELAMNLTMTHRLPQYQMTAISPSPVSDDPFEWKATGYMRVSAIGVDPQHGDNTERSNVYAGLLLGFALSLLLPLVNSIRRAKQVHASGGTT
jgi:hypothetical protein